MSESTATKSKVFQEDVQFAAGGTAAAEEGTRITSTGGEVTLTKIDASHIKFRSISGAVDDLVDGGNDIVIKPSSVTMNGTLTNAAMSSAGYVKNTAAGVFSGGNSIAASDLPQAIDAANIANGTVSNAEFQYLNGVTSSIQAQLAAQAAASQTDQETGSETAKFVAPATQQFHPSAVKAWVMVTGSGTPAIAASYNVASITDNDVGSFTVVFITAFSSANYGVSGIASDEPRLHNNICINNTIPPAAGSCSFIIYEDRDAPGESTYWSVSFFGDQ